MATLTITAANVGVGAGARVLPFTVGQATTHGQPLYIDTSDTLAKLADADAAATAKVACIAVTAASGSGLPVLGLVEGDLHLGAILTAGAEYYLHTTAGLIGLKSDIGAGDFITRIGIARATSILEVRFDASGITI